jgi:DNA-binding response OmpR family regulator
MAVDYPRLHIAPDGLRAVCGNESLVLTRRESHILKLLLDSSGVVVSRQEVVEAVWGV